MNHPCFLSAALFALALGSSTAGESWSLKASDKPLKVTGKLLDPLNVSGAASVKPGELIIACDELLHGVQAGHLDLGNGEISFEATEFPLLEGNKKELDLESAAADPEHHRYYTCGSCSVKRRSGGLAPDRQWLFRIETDPKTGALTPGKVTKVSLKDAMKADAFLNEHMDKSAADLGIDVEGLAFKDGRLWFGLRSPNVNGWGFVVAASADDLMARKPVVFQRYELPLGEDLGIRDIAPLKDGFLFIAGPTGTHEKDKAEPEPKPAEKEPTAKAVTAKPAEETVAKATPAKETVAKAKPAAKPPEETVAKAAPAKETIAKVKPETKPAPTPEPKSIAAPAAPEAANETFALYFWAGDTNKPVHVGEIKRPDKTHGKPEGLLVVSESAEKVAVVVFSDGAENGAPMLYDISRPARQDGPVPRNGK